MSDNYMSMHTDRLNRKNTNKKIKDAAVINDQRSKSGNDQATFNSGAAKDGIRVLVSIKQSILRYGVASLLREQSDFNVVATVGDCVACYQSALQHLPHVLVCDLDTASGCPVEASQSAGCSIEELCKMLPGIPSIVLQDDRSEGQILEATRIGIRGYLTTDSKLENLFKAIRVVKDGGTFLEQRVQSKVMGMLGQLHNGEKTGKVEFLNDREQTILCLLAQGKRNQEIADAVFLSKSSVKRYVSKLYHKLGATNRAEAVKIGIAKNLIRFE